MPGRSFGGVFISYAHDDRAIVGAAARLLRAGGATVFQDVVDIEFGTRWKDALFDALDKCERVMIFWSAAASRSKWVDAEWRCALDAKKKIVPMLLDGTPLPVPLGEFQGVPDMVEMLRAAMRVVPPVGATTGGAASDAPAPAAERSRQRLAAAVGSLATLAVALAAWIGLHGGLASQPDASRGAPGEGAPSVVEGLSGSTWAALAIGGALLIAVVAWCASALLTKARRVPNHEVPALSPAPAAELSVLGSRFTDALFGEPSRGPTQG